MSTTAQLIGRVRFITGQASEQGVTDSDIVAHLNRGQEFLVWSLMASAMPEMCETATGSLNASRVALPSDFCFEQAVEVGTSLITARPYPVTQLDALEDGHIPQFAPSAEQPYYYIWHNATDGAKRLHILLGAPTSTAAYSLRYVRKPTDLDTTSEDPAWNERLCDVLVDWGAMRVHEHLKNFEEMDYRWTLIVDRLRTINSRFQVGQRHETRPSFG